MAVLHNKEQKLEAVLSKLPKKYTDKQFVETFIQLFSKDWGKIKSTYIKQSQDKEPGTIINMPKPDIYLKSILDNYLTNRTNPLPVKKQQVVEEQVFVKQTSIPKQETEEPVAKNIVKAKVVAKKKAIVDMLVNKEQVAVKKLAKIKAPLTNTFEEATIAKKPSKAKMVKDKISEELTANDSVKVKATKAKPADKEKAINKTPVKVIKEKTGKALK